MHDEAVKASSIVASLSDTAVQDGLSDGEDMTYQYSPRHRGERTSLLYEWRLLHPRAKFFAAKAAVIASIGGLLFGYDIGVVEGALPQLRDEMHLRLSQQDMVVALMVAGAVAGSLVAGFLTDTLGRWRTIILTDISFISGSVILASAYNPETVFLGRFVVGAGVAVSAVADVSYLVEVAPTTLRGAMVSTNELAISVGMLGAFLAGHLLRGVEGGWRIMFGFAAVLAALQLVGLAFMPFSPRWLLAQGRREQALTELTKIRNSREDAEAELLQVESSDPGAKGTLRELLTSWRPSLLVTILLAVFQQLTGNANVLNFTHEIFDESGFRGPAPAVVLGVVKVISTAVAIVWVDRVGRRPFLFWGAVGATSSLAAMSVSFAVPWPSLSFLACCALVAAYALSFGPVTWLVTAEMFPAGVRGKALGAGQVGSFAGNLAASSFFLRLLHVAGGAATFCLFAALVFLATVFIYLAVPETKGKEPAEIASLVPSCDCCLTYTELVTEPPPAEMESYNTASQSDDKGAAQNDARLL